MQTNKTSMKKSTTWSIGAMYQSQLIYEQI